MASFGRSDRQEVIWGELNAIRGEVDKGLLSPEDGLEALDPLIALYHPTWDALVIEYAAIHTANETFG